MHSAVCSQEAVSSCALGPSRCAKRGWQGLYLDRLSGTENLCAETVNQLPTDCDRNSASVACAQPGVKCVGMLRVVESQLVEQQRGQRGAPTETVQPQ